MAKVGRPSMYSQELAERICNAIAFSEKGVVSICKENDGFPNPMTIYEWIEKKPEFANLYARAREMQADYMADMINEIADNNSNDIMVTENGLAPNHTSVARDRLRVDARKWVAAKLKPKKYGDKVDVTSDGQSIAPINVIAVSVQSAKEIDKLN